ncbi:MAG: complex I subunit 5 family protein [Candidatus Dormibacteraceae bacterium]
MLGLSLILPVALPLLVGAGLGAANSVHRHRTADAIGLATAAMVTALCALLLVETSRRGLLITWFGGWQPRRGIAIGIDFAVGPISAGLATLTAGLVTASLLFSWRYFDAVGNLYHTLMLVFLGAMVGFCLTGDLFDLFVFFELMSVAGFALAGYEMEEPGPLQGAINFGVANTVAAFTILVGIGLLYGRTGALNLAQMGQALAGHRVDGLLLVGLLCVVCGFLVKAAAAPFHFWLADAHAVAPTPVCVLFSGVMVELGLYAVARVYLTVFYPSLGHAFAFRAVLLAAGVLTLLVGAFECIAQQHLKRLLAFSTISHVGMFLIGIALLTPRSLAAVAVFVAGHGLVKASLFLGTGILMHRFGTVDEGHLFGRGRALKVEGVAFALGGVALAGLPIFAGGLGKELLDDATVTAGLGWVPYLLLLGAALPGAAVLRVAAHVYLGWGGSPEPKGDWESRETKEGLRRTPIVMLTPCLVLLAAALALGLVPGVVPAALAAARLFADTSGYAGAVLGGAPLVARPGAAWETSPSSLALGFAAVAAACGLAVLAVLSGRLPPTVRRLVGIVQTPLQRLRRVQSGVVTDYVSWFVVGVAAYGIALAALSR